MGDIYEITLKKPVDMNDVSYQTEQTIALQKDEFEALSKASSTRIVKDRYKVVLAGYPAEVDVFDGDLKGLVVIDFEFASLDDKAAFNPPEVCLAEVTQEYFIAGGHLPGKTYADIESELNRFNYTKL